MFNTLLLDHSAPPQTVTIEAAAGKLAGPVHHPFVRGYFNTVPSAGGSQSSGSTGWAPTRTAARLGVRPVKPCDPMHTGLVSTPGYLPIAARFPLPQRVGSSAATAGMATGPARPGPARARRAGPSAWTAPLVSGPARAACAGGYAAAARALLVTRAGGGGPAAGRGGGGCGAGTALPDCASPLDIALPAPAVHCPPQRCA